MRAALFGAVLGCLFSFGAQAAVTPNAPIWPQTPQAVIGKITNANGTTPQTLLSGGTNATKVVSIICSNTDTASYTLQLFYNTSSTNYVLASVTIAISAGNVAGTPSQSLLTSAIEPGVAVDGSGNPYLLVKSGDSLTIGLTGTITSGKQVQCLATASDF